VPYLGGQETWVRIRHTQDSKGLTVHARFVVYMAPMSPLNSPTLCMNEAWTVNTFEWDDIQFIVCVHDLVSFWV
jgi:hypothetical protein